MNTEQNQLTKEELKQKQSEYISKFLKIRTRRPKQTQEEKQAIKNIKTKMGDNLYIMEQEREKMDEKVAKSLKKTERAKLKVEKESKPKRKYTRKIKQEPTEIKPKRKYTRKIKQEPIKQEQPEMELQITPIQKIVNIVDDVKEGEHYIVKLQNKRKEIDQQVKESFKKLNDKLVKSMKDTELGKRIKDMIRRVITLEDNVTINFRLYIEAEHNEEENEDGTMTKRYTKDYNFTKDFNRYLYDSSKTVKYVMCYNGNVTLKRKHILKFIVERFYNDVDDDMSVIKSFISTVCTADSNIKDSIGIMEQSKIISGFKILSLTEFNEKYQEPDYLNMNLKDDSNCKGINSKFTQYILNMESDDLKNMVDLNYNDYVKSNFHSNSCVLTAIINKYHHRFNETKSDGKRRYKELTYQYLAQILEIEYKGKNMECSIHRAIEKFFKRYEFTGIYVYDCWMNLLCKHLPNPKNNNPLVMRVMVKDKHLYELNENIKQLQQIVNTEDDERQNLIVSNKYYISESKSEVAEFFADSEEEILEIIKTESPKEEVKEMIIIFSDFRKNLSDVLFGLVKGGYIPKVQFNNTLYKLSLYLNKTNIQIIANDNNNTHGMVMSFMNLEDYQEYQKAYETYYQSIIKREYISEYHPSVIEIEKQYKINNSIGYFGEYSGLKYYGLDENKAYPDSLMKIKKIPKFNYFDVYEVYQNQEIQDLSQYIIEVKNTDERTAIIFNEKYSRTFGYVLKQITNIDFKILYVRNPLKIEDVDFATPTNNLFQNEKLQMSMKKAIAVITIGLLEKKSNKGEISKIFNEFNEANYYNIKYNGDLLALKNENEKLYLVKVSEKQELINGFLPIKEMVYLNQRLKLLSEYDKLINLGLVVRGIKTDCIYFEGDHKIVKSNFPMSNKIGDFKFEYDKSLPNQKIEIVANKLIDINDFSKPKIKIFDDELNTKSINQYIKDENKIFLVKGLYPGVGKSTLCKNFDNNALFVCPYNTLCQNLRIDGYNAITYSKLFGLFGSDEETKLMKTFDISEYSTIVFDEIFLYEPQRLKRVADLMQAYPEKYFLATGDCDQRAPVGFNNSEYLEKCMNILFNNQILLQDIKRFKDEKDKQLIKQLKSDIFNNAISIESICDKYGLNKVYKMQDVTSKLNVCLFNFRCDNVNEHIHQNIMKKNIKFEVGQQIICRKYDKINKLTTNYTYKITKMTPKEITIIDEVEETTHKFPPILLNTHFKLPYAVTCDSVQGITKNEKLTVFDSNTPYVDRKFLWTAMTRVTILQDVSIFIHSTKEIESLTQSRLKLYLRNKIDSYKMQDRKANREYNINEYITVEWIHEKIDENLYCPFCKKHYELFINEESNVRSNITVDRIDNNKAHLLTNCQLCCHHCNITKGNRY